MKSLEITLFALLGVLNSLHVFFPIVNEVGTHVFCSIRYCNDEYFLKFHEIDRLILYKYKKYKLIQ